MSVNKLFPINSQPGVRRDGTSFSSQYHSDSQWCRFQRGLPRKMGGYKQIVGSLPNIIRGVYVVPNSPNFNVFIGDQSSLKNVGMDQNGVALGAPTDRTPAGFMASPNNVWQFDNLFSTTSSINELIAHAAPNLASISSTDERPVYYGDQNGAGPLLPTGTSVSGGIAVFQPYLFMFGNAGQVFVSQVNDPTTLLSANPYRIASQKIVAGMPTRGGNNSPAGLLWSLDSVIRVTFSPTSLGTPDFRFDTISNQSSILSSRSIVEYDGLYFWAGIDRFLVYNGIVQEVPNQLNLNYFYRNLNYAQRQKVWAAKVPQFGEIWWFYPSGANTECDRAVIFNKRENTWYDTSLTGLPVNTISSFRGAGYFEQVFADPIWADNDPSAAPGNYALWMHESGTNKVVNGVSTAIPSWFETGNVSWNASGPLGQWTGVDRWVELYRLEPDFVLNDDTTMTFTVNGRKYANSPQESNGPYTFDNTTTKVDVRAQYREMTLQFYTASLGGFYEAGQNLLIYRVGDGHQ